MQTPKSVVALLSEWIELFAYKSMGGIFQQLKVNDLSVFQMGILLRIRQKSICGISEIGDDFGITSAAASQMMDRMVQLGFVSRSEATHDRRVRQIKLTEKGQQILQDSQLLRPYWSERFCSTLTPAEVEQVSEVMRLLIEKIHQLETSGAETP